MPEAPPNTRPPLVLPLVVWALCAAWAVATSGFHLVRWVYAETVLNVDTQIYNRDFVNYWVSSRLALAGDHTTMFLQDRYYPYLQLLFGADYPVHAWSYPPHFLLVVSPLSLMPYRPSMAVFLLVTFGLFVWATQMFVREFAPGVSRWLVALGVAAFSLVMAETTQNGFLMAAALLCAFANQRRRPVLAGLALAVLTMKPQLGFLVPLLALLDRNWAVLKWGTAFTVLLVGVSIAFYGVDSWQAFFTHVLPYQDFVMKHWGGAFLDYMPGAYGSLRSLGVAVQTAFAVHLVVSLLALLSLWPLLARSRDPLERVFIVLAVTFVFTPYSFHYDMGALSVAAACLALRARAAGEPGLALAYAVITVLPALVPLLGGAHAPVSTLILAAGLGALYASARRSDPAVSAPS